MRAAILASMALVVLICIGFGLPLMRRKIGPNGTTGIRTAETLADPEVWYDVNEYGGRLMVISGAAIGVLTVGLYLIPSIGDLIYALIVPTVLTVVLIAVSAMAFKYTKTVVAARRGISPSQVAQTELHGMRVLVLVFSILFMVVMIVPGVLLGMGRIGPNPVIGFRVTETLRDPRVWYEANSYAGWLMVIAGAAAGVLGIGLYRARRVSDIVYMVVGLTTMILLPAVMALLSLAYLRTLTGS